MKTFDEVRVPVGSTENVKTPSEVNPAPPALTVPSGGVIAYRYFQIGDMHFYTSTETKEIDAALAKAQANFETVKKSRTRHSSQGGGAYATLDDVYTATRKHLNKEGLFFSQPPVQLTDKGVAVVSMLRHSSGQWIACRFSMPLERTSAHGVGSAVTYCKRYSAEGLLGVNGEEDDDGNAAVGGNDGQRSQGSKGKGSKAVASKPPAKPEEPPPEDLSVLVTKPKLQQLSAIVKESKYWNNESVQLYIQTILKKEKSAELTLGEYKGLLDVVLKRKPSDYWPEAAEVES